MKFSNYLSEAPINDYEFHGNWDKNSSFRDPRDRRLITNPRTIDFVKKKFENTDYVFNFIFVNSPKANRHTEVGKVSMDWVRQNLDPSVADSIEKKIQSEAQQDDINVIFTNNKGAQRKNMTAWIIAHRLGHAFKRSYYYDEASEYLQSAFQDISRYYNVDFDYTTTGTYSTRFTRPSRRDSELAMRNFFTKVCTFKSARDGKIRDWFEVLNEFVAQLLTTGGIKFNPAPQSFKVGHSTYYCKDDEEVNDMLDTLANTIEYQLNAMLGTMHGDIYVM